MSDSLLPNDLQHGRLPLPIAISRSLLKLRSIESVSLSNHLIPLPSCLQSFPASESFLMCQLLASDGQGIRAPASVSVLPMNIQDWFPLGWTGWTSLQSKGSSTQLEASIPWCSAFSVVQISHPYMTAGKTIALTIQTFFAKWCLCFWICCLDWS